MLPNAAFISPNAPFPCDMAPMGYQWFSLQEWTEDAIREGLKRVQPMVDDFIDAQLEAHGLNESKLVYIGSLLK